MLSIIQKERQVVLAENAWLNLTEQELAEIGIGPLREDIFRENQRVPLPVLRLLKDLDCLPFTCKHILNIEILPLQHLMLKNLFHYAFPMLIASRGFGKTFILAVYCFLRMMLNPGCKVVVAGAGMRQSRLLTDYMTTIWNNAPILRNIGGRNSGVKNYNDKAEFILGPSKTTAIPIGTGEKIRGLRANYIVMDEFASHSKEIFQRVIQGFASVTAEPVENVKITAKREYLRNADAWDLLDEEKFQAREANQTIIAGTAYYSFNLFYEYYKLYKDIILAEDDKSKIAELFGDESVDDIHPDDFVIMRIPYSLIPRGFMDDKQVSHNRATASSSLHMMEYGAVFCKDSDGFFKRVLIQSCVVPIDWNGTTIDFKPLLRGRSGYKYVMGVDPASESDNFAIVILEINGSHRRVVYSWTITKKEQRRRSKREAGAETDFYAYVARKIRSLMQIFDIERIGMDIEGGGRAVEEALHNKNNLLEGEVPIWQVIEEKKIKDTDANPGLHIIEPINFSSHEWVSTANHGLKKDLEDKFLLFPAFDAALLGMAIEETEVEISREDVPYDTLEDCLNEIEELKDELVTIVCTPTAITGRERWDTPEIKLPGSKKGRQRKDRYSALLIANMMGRAVAPRQYAIEYHSHGGFIGSVSAPAEDDMHNAPSWWKEKMRGVYD